MQAPRLELTQNWFLNDGYGFELEVGDMFWNQFCLKDLITISIRGLDPILTHTYIYALNILILHVFSQMAKA